MARGGSLFEAARAGSPLEDRGCVTTLFATVPRECAFGDTTARTTVVLYGDSHGDTWFPALDIVARRNAWRLVTMIKFSCPVAQVPVYNREMKRPYDECNLWRRASLARIVAMRPAAVIIAQWSRREATG